jgi:hypothetical protein
MQRIAEAAATMPSHAAVTGWAALHWYGARWFDGRSADGRSELPVMIASCDQDIRPQPGIALSQERLVQSEIVEHDGLRMVVPERAAFFEMRYAPGLRDAVVVVDMAAYDDLVSIDEITDYALAHPGWTGVPRAREALAYADENSWSPWESRLRLVWQLDAGLERPLTNRPLFDRRGQIIGTPDLFDPTSGTAADYDGEVHLVGSVRSSDISREHRLRSHRLEHLVVVREHMVDRQSLAARLTQTRARALTMARAPVPSWTLDEPWWWEPSYTVAQRRLLTGRAKEAVDRLRRRAS